MARGRRLLWGIGACAAGGVAAAAALPGDGLGDDPVERAKLRFSAIKRGTRAFAALGAVTIDYKWSIRGMDHTTEEYKSALQACHMRAADRLLALCSSQAGVYIKAGQLLASTRPFIPVEFSSALAHLHDNAPQSSLADVGRVFREDMGVEIASSFEWFDPTPVGCASLAQVHRAGLKNAEGEVEVVAVKVQHAWMSDHTSSDVTAMLWAAMAVDMAFTDVEVQWLIPIFRANLLRELDFRLECENAIRCASNFKGDESVYVPKTIDSLSSRRIVTMEYIDGIKVDRVDELTRGGFDAQQVAHMVTKAFGEMVFHHGFVHCDPHPGNMLIRWKPSQNGRRQGKSGGCPQLVILDHGLYREIDEDVRLNYCRLWQAMILQDEKMLATVALDLGVGDFAFLLPIVFINRSLASKTRLGDTLTKEERQRIKAEVLPESFRRETFEFGAAMDFMESLPRDLLFIMRTQSIVRALCSDLGYVARNRFKIYARLAAGNARSSKSLSVLRKWLRGIRLETRILFMEVMMWVSEILPWLSARAQFGLDEELRSGQIPVDTGNASSASLEMADKGSHPH